MTLRGYLVQPKHAVAEPYFFTAKAEADETASMHGTIAEPVYSAATPEDAADLLERLKEGCQRTGEGDNGEDLYDVEGATDDMWEAFNVITSQSAELLSLRRKVEETEAALAEANLDRCFASDADPACKLESEFNKIADAERARAESAERKVEEQRKALAEVVAGVQEWCDAVKRDTSWDSWDHHYKRFAYNGGLDLARALAGDRP